MILLESLRSSTSRFLETLRTLSDEELRQHSTLEDWSRAHVAGHVARNADALLNLVEWARTGEQRSMYTSPAAQLQGIAETATLSHEELCDDVAESAERLHRAMRKLTSLHWSRPIHWRHERDPGTAEGVVLMRWAEVEIHHTDLRAGYTFTDWPAAFVQTMLPRLVEDREVKATAVPATLKTGDGTVVEMTGGGPLVTGTHWSLVAWLTGRAPIPKAPDLPPWR